MDWILLSKVSIDYNMEYCCIVYIPCWLGNIAVTKYCTLTLSPSSVKAFKYAIKNHYWYQMYIGESSFRCFYVYVVMNGEFLFMHGVIRVIE